MHRSKMNPDVSAQPERKNLERHKRRAMPQPWVIGHRGASALAPENTLAAFRLAGELGAGFIEADLRATRDGAIIALHDASVDRTTPGRGPLTRFTLDELRELDAGSWFDPRFAGERIPTLEEILDWSRKARLGLFLEIKGEPTGAFLETLLAGLERSGGHASAVVISFDPGTLAALRRLKPRAATGLLFDAALPDPVRAAEKAGAARLLPRRDLMDPELVERAHRAGLAVVAWTVNETAEMRRLAALGVDGVMTDRPDRLIAALGEG
jgi:glycerophosphoryl diester phosphodiesterase